MPIDPSLILGLKTLAPENPADSMARAYTLRSLTEDRKQRRQIGDQQRQEHDLKLEEARRKIAEDAAVKGVFAGPGDEEQKISELFKINPQAAYALQKEGRANAKAALDNREAELKVQHGQAEALGAIASGISDEDSYHRGVGKALADRLIPREEALQLLNQPYDPTRVDEWKRQSMTAQQGISTHLQELAGERAAQTQQAQLPGIKADSQRKTVEAAQIAAGGMLEKDAATLEGAEASRQQTITRDTETARHNKASEKTAAQRAAMTGSGAGGALTDDDFKRAGEEFAITGVMPQLGNGSGTVKQRLLHEKQEFARRSNLTPRELALAGASFKGDSKSLSAFQSQRDQIVSFEQTAGKNLDLFVQAAAKIPDTGSPWLNAPLRLLNEKLVGSENMAAVNVARQVAVNEIAKVTSGGGLSGVLSDHARREVAEYNPANATFKQTLAIAKTLRADMANRHTSMDEMLDKIKGRIGDVSGNSGNSGNPGTGMPKADPLGIR